MVSHILTNTYSLISSPPPPVTFLATSLKITPQSCLFCPSIEVIIDKKTLSHDYVQNQTSNSITAQFSSLRCFFYLISVAKSISFFASTSALRPLVHANTKRWPTWRSHQTYHLDYPIIKLKWNLSWHDAPTLVKYRRNNFTNLTSTVITQSLDYAASGYYTITVRRSITRAIADDH